MYSFTDDFVVASELFVYALAYLLTGLHSFRSAKLNAVSVCIEALLSTEETSTVFRSLKLEGWRQFDSIDLELHPRLTVITGANGAGKTSLLRIFSRHLGYDRPFLSTPRSDKNGVLTYTTGVFNSVWKLFRREKRDATDVGSLIYSNGTEAWLQVPSQTGVQYSLNIANQQNVLGMHIDAHQPISPYQAISQIPIHIINSQAAYDSYNNEHINKYQGSHTGLSPVFRMKEAIISMAVFGEGNSRVRSNPEILKAYTSFVDALRKMLPETLGFIDIAVRTPDVVIVTKTGEFLLDAASGGLTMLIDLTWRLHMFSLNHRSFVVTIDEPENHLHPTMQRTLMNRLLHAFPQAQFIIATHSPFMVSSVKDSNVYVLRYRQNEQRTNQSETALAIGASRVVSERLDTVNKAGTASEILREVLGVSATVPEWVEEGLAEVIAEYRNQAITSDSLKLLRAKLASLGYDQMYPEALAAITLNK